MKHPKKLKGFDSLDDAALCVSILRYDSLEDFLNYLAIEIKQQSQADKLRGRKKLAKVLKELGLALDKSTNQARKAWKISRPFMK